MADTKQQDAHPAKVTHKWVPKNKPIPSAISQNGNKQIALADMLTKFSKLIQTDIQKPPAIKD